MSKILLQKNRGYNSSYTFCITEIKFHVAIKTFYVFVGEKLHDSHPRNGISPLATQKVKIGEEEQGNPGLMKVPGLKLRILGGIRLNVMLGKH